MHKILFFWKSKFCCLNIQDNLIFAFFLNVFYTKVESKEIWVWGCGGPQTRCKRRRNLMFAVFFASLSSLTFGWGAVYRKGTEHLFADTNSPTAYLLGGLIFYLHKGENMKTTGVMALTLLLSGLPMAVSAKTENVYNIYNTYNEYNKFNQPDDLQNEVPNEPNVEQSPEINKNKNPRFFISLGAPLIQHTNFKIVDKETNTCATVSRTALNSDVFNDTSFTIGFDKNDFRFALHIVYNNAEASAYSDNVEGKETVLGVSLDAPVIKQMSTFPFVRLRMGYTSAKVEVNNQNDDINGSFFGMGLGIAHNFTQDVFGTMTAMYHIARMNNSDIDIRADGFSVLLDLGYKF